MDRLVHPFARFTETKSKYLTACDERGLGAGAGEEPGPPPPPLCLTLVKQRWLFYYSCTPAALNFPSEWKRSKNRVEEVYEES